MLITPVENIDGLYTIENVYDEKILNIFLQENFSNLANKPLNLQKQFTLRKNIKFFPSNSKWKLLRLSLDQNDIHNLGYKISDSALWIDEVGHSMSVHEDNEGVIAAMQVYLKDGPKNSGTTFFNTVNKFSYLVPYKKNCGYLMINKKQPHGLLSPITEERWSIYNWLDKIG